MIFRLDNGILDRGPGRGSAKGLSCDEHGIRLGGDCMLVTPETIAGRRVYQARALADIRDLLRSGLGWPGDALLCHKALQRAARLTTTGEWGLAQISALQLQLPRLADFQAVDRLRKVDAVLRFNPNHEPAGPGGGEFASASSGTSGAGLSRPNPNEDRARLIAAQDKARTNPVFRPGRRTHCNQALVAVVRSLNGPLEGLLDARGRPLRANEMADNLIHSSAYQEVTHQQAQHIANLGALAVVAYRAPPGMDGHVATLRPENVIGDTPLGRTGPLLNNIGRRNGVLRQSMVFRAGTKVRYYSPK